MKAMIFIGFILDRCVKIKRIAYACMSLAMTWGENVLFEAIENWLFKTCHLYVLVTCDQYSMEVRSEGPNKNKQLFALTQIF